MTIWEKFQAGGIFMYFILIFGVAIIGLIVERTIALYLLYKEAPGDLRQKLLSYISRSDYRAALDHIEVAAKDTGLGRIASVGLAIRDNNGGEEELQARMDERLSTEISAIDKRTGFLSMLGNVGTLLGLLGTVTGLINSFAGVANANPAERATLLGAGISEALNTTAFGLTVAIPALVAYAIFQNKTDNIVTRLTETSSEIYHDLLFYSESKSRYEELPESIKAGLGTAKAEETEVNA